MRWSPNDPPAAGTIYRRALWSLVSSEAAKTRRSHRGRPLWSRIGNLCGLGSTSATWLCEELGFHPDTGAVVRERGWEPAPQAEDPAA